jgi:drug/metabolite transporter (DMT)-like permease
MKNWVMFGLVGLIWGSSFLLIKMGLQELTAFSLVSGRLGFAAIAFAVALIALRKPLPRDPKSLIMLAIVGMVNTAIPFLLITSGEQTIDSGLASVLDATVPLFSIWIAHVALHDDKIYMGKVLGLLAGFGGVIILALRQVDPTHPNPFAGQFAVLLASLFYAVGTVLIRRYLRDVDPIVTAGGSLFVGAIVVIVVTVLFTRPLPDIAALTLQTKLAVLGLALVNTFVAYVLFFTLIQNWGPSRATMVTYLIPPVGLALGAVVYGEPLDASIIIGTALIIGGIAFANFRKPKAVEAVEMPPAPA